MKVDGTVVTTDADDDFYVSRWIDIIAVSAGDRRTVGLRKDGTVATSPIRDLGWTDIIAVSAGDDHIVGLKADGTVVATGSNSYGQCDVWGWLELKVN